MKAAQLVAHGSPGRFELRELPDPVPGPGEAIVEVHACGLNRLDLWLENAELPLPITLPRTPGCEMSGTIAALGTDANADAGGPWRIGDRVAVQSNLFCGTCEFCRNGEESRCVTGELLGVQRDGGFAEQVLVPARSLVRLPAGVSFETAAALTLAGSTALHMITRRASAKAGDWVLVIGASSGVGSAAIQIARGLGCRVIATASSEAKRALAVRLGAESVVDSGAADWPAEVRRITGRRGVDLVVEHVGGAVLEKCFLALARGGTIVTCGATAGRQVSLNLWPFFVKEQRLIGSYGRTRADLVETLEWAADGRLQPVIDRGFPLDGVPEAFAALRTRQVLGKIVVRPR